MDKLPPRLRLLILMLAGWLNQEQQAVTDYLKEEGTGACRASPMFLSAIR